MATIAITSLPVAAAAAVTDVLPIVQSGTTKQVTNALLFTNSTLVAPALGTPISGVRMIPCYLKTSAVAYGCRVLVSSR